MNEKRVIIKKQKQIPIKKVSILKSASTKVTRRTNTRRRITRITRIRIRTRRTRTRKTRTRKTSTRRITRRTRTRRRPTKRPATATDTLECDGGELGEHDGQREEFARIRLREWLCVPQKAENTFQNEAERECRRTYSDLEKRGIIKKKEIVKKEKEKELFLRKSNTINKISFNNYTYILLKYL